MVVSLHFQPHDEHFHLQLRGRFNVILANYVGYEI